MIHLKHIKLLSICAVLIFNGALAAKVGILTSYKFTKLNLGLTDFDNDLNYSPEIRNGAISLGFVYDDLEVSIALGIPSSANKIADFKNRAYTDFTTNYWGDKFAAQLYWQSYNGYYTDFSPARTYPDLSVTKFGVNVLFPVLNSEYTARTLVGRSEKKKIFMATMILGGSAFYNSVRSGADLVNSTDPAAFDRLYGFKSGIFGNVIFVFGGAVPLTWEIFTRRQWLMWV